MNDLWQEGFNTGYRDGDRDGYARGWHEALRMVNQQKNTGVDNCPKCQRPLTDLTTRSCNSWACPAHAQSRGGIDGDT